MFMYLSYEHTGATHEVITDLINRNHATSIYAVNKIRVQKEIYSDVKKEVENIELQLFGNFSLVVETFNLLRITEFNTNLII